MVLGKPAPEIFEAACSRLGVEPARALVFEDAQSGVEGARAAGCTVVAVLSHQLQPAEMASLAGERTTVLRSLLDCDLGSFGLPPFTDRVLDTLPLPAPLRFKGEVIRGFGRGSKVLGIPTANLDASKLGVGAAHACGIYLGWASVGSDATVHKMARRRSICRSVGASSLPRHFVPCNKREPPPSASAPVSTGDEHRLEPLLQGPDAQDSGAVDSPHVRKGLLRCVPACVCFDHSRGRASLAARGEVISTRSALKRALCVCGCRGGAAAAGGWVPETRGGFHNARGTGA